MTCIAIIPARGGSKGVPRKNVRALAGKPLIAHVIEQLRGATRVDRVWVSTDDPEIALEARRYGAEVVIRPETLANDTATSESAILHALEQLPTDELPDLVMMVQCTSPLTLSEDFDGLVRAVERDDADSAFTASLFHHFLWRRADDGTAEPINHDGAKRKRRQDLKPHYLENGAAYVMRREPFQRTGERFCGKVTLYEMDASRTLEIDTPDDFTRAEAAMAARDRCAAAQSLPRPVRALVMDFDGVFTDNRVLVADDGREAVFCDRGDGMGLELIAELGIHRLILSKERNPVVMRRAEKLQLECLHGIDNKPAALRDWLDARGISPAETIFIGNDVNDLGCMELVGFSVAPRDAHPKAIAAADLVLSKDGGRGALRELCDLIASSTP